MRSMISVRMPPGAVGYEPLDYVATLSGGGVEGLTDRAPEKMTRWTLRRSVSGIRTSRANPRG
jgi:hypothetical protein